MNVIDLRQLLAFDDWANDRLFAAAVALRAEELERRVALGSSSLLETLRHIVVEEWLWFRRCQARGRAPLPAWALDGDREAVSNALAAVQAERRSFLAGLADAALDEVVAFLSLEGHEHRHSIRDMLIHTVNHSTYHRGQAALLLRQVGGTPTETDFVVFREAFDGGPEEHDAR